VDGLREIGLIEGCNLKLEVRWGSSDVERLREYASELIGLAPEVLLAGSTPGLAALHRATANIPIVFVLVSDPVGQGYVQSLAHPGGNVTGFTSFEFSAIGKWLGLLKDVAPSTRRAAVIFNPDTAPYTQQYLQPFKDAAETVAVEATTAPVRSDTDIERAIVALAGREGGIIIMSDPFTSVHRTAILSMAARHRVPAVYPIVSLPLTAGCCLTAPTRPISFGAPHPMWTASSTVQSRLTCRYSSRPSSSSSSI